MSHARIQFSHTRTDDDGRSFNGSGTAAAAAAANQIQSSSVENADADADAIYAPDSIHSEGVLKHTHTHTRLSRIRNCVSTFDTSRICIVQINTADSSPPGHHCIYAHDTIQYSCVQIECLCSRCCAVLCAGVQNQRQRNKLNMSHTILYLYPRSPGANAARSTFDSC